MKHGEKEQKQENTVKCSRFKWLKRCGMILLILLALAAACYLFIMYVIYGTTTVRKGSGKYEEFSWEKIDSALVVFPQRELQTQEEEFYLRFQDEIFSPVCQVYLKRQYAPEQFAQEIERLESLELSYLGQTNRLYVDDDNYCGRAYVALANWHDRFEYALVIENLHTIIYV